MENTAWERLPNETAEQYQYFREFLLMRPVRRIDSVAQIVQKSPSHIRALAAKYDWRTRAEKYDNTLLDSARETIRRRLPEVLIKQWNDCTEIAALAAAELRRRDLAKASFKSLNEILANSHVQSQKIAELLHVMDDTSNDNTLQIKIISAEDQTENS